MYPLTLNTMDKADIVFQTATLGGYSITGPAVAIAIRAAILECTDETGKLNVSDLYDLTCKLEQIKQ